jgi:pseudomonalisin
MGLRRPLVGLIAAATLLLPVAIPAIGTAISSAATATSVAGVPGTTPLLVQGARDMGLTGGGAVNFTLTLPLTDRAGLDALIARQTTPGTPDYHRYLSPAEFEARFSPTAATVDAVTSWAAGQGLRVESVSANRTLLQLSGTPAAVGAAFGVSIHDFVTPQGLRYHSPTQPGLLPSALSGKVAGVVGLSTLGRLAGSPARRPSVLGTVSSLTSKLGVGHLGLGKLGPAAALGQSLTPQDLRNFYNAPPADSSSGQTIAVLAEGNVTQVANDLRTFEDNNGLPHVSVKVVPTGGPSGDLSGLIEWDLDTQSSTGIAPGVAGLVLYDATSLNDPDILAEINRWVSDGTVKQASASFGECESLAQLSGLEQGGDQALKQAVAQGQTLFASSGDNGSFCPSGVIGINGVPLGLPGQSYPAASPYAIGVGGTTITGLPAPLAEISWLSGGGGVSLSEPVASFQTSAGGSFLPVARGVPDVAFDADPLSGYTIVMNGRSIPGVGGTSLSAPCWLGVWARAQGAHSGGLGFAGPVIYTTEPASAFNDIIVGDNVPYPATPGWDYNTGRGTPNIAAFVAAA